MYYVAWKDASGMDRFDPVSNKESGYKIMVAKLSNGNWACLIDESVTKIRRIDDQIASRR